MSAAEKRYGLAEAREQVAEGLAAIDGGEGMAWFSDNCREVLLGWADSLDHLEKMYEMERRLLAWSHELDSNRDRPGDVGKFIAAELLHRMKLP